MNCPSSLDKTGKEGLSGITCPVACQSRVAPRPKSGLQAQCGGGLENPWLGTEWCVPLHASADRLHLALEHRRVHRFHSTLPARYRTGIEQRLRSAASDHSQAGPGPPLGPLHQTSPQRVPLDVPQNHQKVFVLLDRKGFESPLPNVAGGVIMPLVAADVGREQPVHPAAQVSISQGPERQMKMVRQHAICQNPHGVPQLRFGQEVDKRVEITVFVKNAGPVIAPVQHVVA